MCMITYLPAGVPVPTLEIETGGTWNDDGHGWAVAAETGNMITGRYMDLELALITFRTTREAFPDSPAMFHSRWATHGVTDTSNVHPFPVGRYSVMAHNGILPSKVRTSQREYAFHPAKGDPRSDTRILAEDYMLQAFSPRGTFSRRERRWIGKVIGTSNKLCILTVSPKLERPKGLLVNGMQGNWHNGAWFSNYDYDHDWAQYRHTPTKYYGKGSYVWDNDTWMSKGETDPKDGHGTNPSGNGKTLARRNVDECRYCLGVGDMMGWRNVCEYCLTCQDCGEHTDACLCSYGGKSAKESAEVFDVAPFCIKCSRYETDCDCETSDIIHVGPYAIGGE